MEKRTKKFSCDLPIAEFKEIDQVLQRSKLTRREWHLRAVRKNQTNSSNITENDNFQEIIRNAQEEINEAYQTVSDLYINAGAALLSTDREKAIELLANSFELDYINNSPTFSKTTQID